ncbi:MAG: hypothetical protein U9N87_11400, partial [Planctomycetota bacterium]|nr:hypothetical protein [Planctomycetota bacterium]
NLANGELDEWRQNFRAIYSDEHFDATPLIRACLERGASSNIRYEETGTHRRLDAPAKLPPPKTSSRERRALAQHRASKAATNRRCRCGSGKMFKNCCGKR